MRIVLIADAFPPMRTSAAVQMRDLAREYLRQGYHPTVVVPAPGQGKPWMREDMDGIEVIRLDAPQTKDVGYLQRTVAELLTPVAMIRNLSRSPLAQVRWDSVVWYSPSIFLGAVAHWLKRKSACPSYLIVRDIFPEWAVDMGLMGRGLPYWFFKIVERYQYSVADTIGVQTPANLPYFNRWAKRSTRRVEVLQNWLADTMDIGCTIRVADGKLAGRTILVYAGNMGVAQGMDILVDLAERLRTREDIGFLFVGRGSEVRRLQESVIRRGLENVVFHDEIDPSEIVGLYAQCQIGIVALDPRHKTHNIPGKFLSYMQAGLPVLANINAGNDLVTLIEREKVGKACGNHDLDTLERLACELVDDYKLDRSVSKRCRALAAKMFSPQAVVAQILVASGRKRVLAGSSIPARASLGHEVDETDLQREEA
ncbi:glycosyltransferase WbuB [Massilia varians]|uniref:Glycosyltransferase WbuB n=1 Tax=Massilia varians TaxID=457921 RepID=A0ABM8CBF0_9BURK|nr:glycosyltransferase family 4 protein [Massilia varians]BDT60629.1 glycosyltransferase WbuB [Massilia varians]